MVVKSFLEDLEGRMRLKRVWKLIPPAGKKEEQRSRGGQWFWIFGISPEWLVDRVCHAGTWGRRSTERAEGARSGRRRKNTEPTDLSAMGES